jgi:hypothetical protein
MIFKYDIRLLFIALIFFLNNNNCIYLPSGINTLNKFLYLSRISKYNNQNKTHSCSLNDGPNCYFTEDSYVKHYIQTKNEDKDFIINNEWAKLHSKMQQNKKNYTYQTINDNLYQHSLNYIKSFSKKKDSDQNPSTEKLNILMTFDDDTTKKNMYLEKLSNIFYNEKLIADFQGRLRLSDEEQLSKSEIDKNKKKILDYPSKLYGIIESEYVSISFRGKKFVCNYCYIRVHNKESKSEEIHFYGYLGDKILYGYSYTDKKDNDENWVFVTFPDVIIIDKLVISGPYDIDNISFTFQYEITTDSQEIFYMYNHLRIDDLVDNEDI